MNKVCLIGRLTKDVDLKYTNDQKAVGRFNVAVRRNEDKTDFISCVSFGKTAENIATFFKKGKLIGITGNLTTGSYEKDGQTHYTTDVFVESFTFLEKSEKKEDEPTPSNFAAISEDIPF